MSRAFPHLFQPLQLRHLTLPNRIVFGAHTANMSEAGLPGERHRAYYEERARGGAAMIVVEPMPVHRTAVDGKPDGDQFGSKELSKSPCWPT
jgi:2,4-dienoyl-CoA reductase-like NADH-dependent reductase (Old Yellow Enzyme family)